MIALAKGTVGMISDIPSVAEPPQTEPLFVSPSSFGGTLRQSQIRLQAFGPDIGGAAKPVRTCILILLAGSRIHEWRRHGSRASAHGDDSTGWANTSIVAGQERFCSSHAGSHIRSPHSLFPRSPMPGTFGRGHRKSASSIASSCRASSFSFQAGILDSLSGDLPEGSLYPLSIVGRESGQPGLLRRGFPGVITRFG